MKFYQIGEKCCMCDEDKWTDSSKIYTRIFILTGTTSDCSHILIDDKLIGIRHGGKKICIPCLLLLVGLEEYYDEFYYNLLENQEAKYIINKIKSDKNLLKKVAKIRSGGKYIPKEIISDIIHRRENIKNEKE
jgi:hypothetical protein